MKFTLGIETNALYIYANVGDIAETIEVGPDVFMDVDADGKIIGIEFLDPNYLIQFLRERGGELDFDKPFSREQAINQS